MSESTPHLAESKILRHSPAKLFGRDAQLQELDRLWEDPGTNILTIVAWGGVGKTALTAHWMARLARRNWPEVDAYFDWSFYSQGADQKSQSSADLFINEALTFFKDPDPNHGSPADRGKRLAGLIQQQKTLLILDGIEPLQHPPGLPELAGQLKDPALEALMRELAVLNPGLCVLTTREPVTDLEPFEEHTAPSWKLEHLPVAAAVPLLKNLGVHGSAEDLESACNEVRGHALTLNLLGRYLARAHQGDIRRRDRVKFEKADAQIQGGHAFRVIAAYERWLQAGNDESRRQLALLRLLGLFERPADAACLAALTKEPAIVDLSEQLVRLDEETWNATVHDLEQLGLLTPQGDSLDAHPLVREFFSKQLRSDADDAWRAAHSRLFDHLCETTDHQPDDLAGLQPLYQAVAHGCRANRHTEACCDVYIDRILRGDQESGFFSTRKLGAIGANLAAIASFFCEPWSKLDPNVPQKYKGCLLNEVAIHLLMSGRLSEALLPIQEALETACQSQSWSEAARRATCLCQVHATLGNLREAVRFGKMSVQWADLSNDIWLRVHKRTSTAEALSLSGDTAAAKLVFTKAEELQTSREPSRPQLYGLRGFRYCEVLLQGAERMVWDRKFLSTLEAYIEVSNHLKEAERRSAQSLDWVSNDILLDISLDHLTLSRIALYKRAIENPLASETLKVAQRHLEKSVNGLRGSGERWMLPRGLLTRAWYHWENDEQDAALQDLDEAWQISRSGSMKLYMADCQLLRARLFHDHESLADAKRLINECGYHRRDAELNALEEAAKNWPIDEPPLTQELAEAMPDKKPVSIFVSYSHKFKEDKDSLLEHLGLLRHQGLIAPWTDDHLSVAEEWDGVIKEQLESAEIIILLISAAFTNSKYIWDTELKRAMERHDAGEAKVVPVYARSCDLKDAPFSKLQRVPSERPIAKYEDTEEGWAEVAAKIRALVESLPS